ncbi:hypothetical protein [Reichenbachiella sp.]|uniref:hypothetical protein n=1 Tax=Reichenbachiella sp. TaxID=2184521 RepID=UPI003B5A49C1
MPHIWNDILVVTKEELIPEWWSSYESLKKELQRYSSKSYGIKRAQRGGNNRQLLIRFDSLPREIQDGIGDPRKLNHPLEAYYQVDADAVTFYVDFTYPDGSYIKPETQEKYIVNASVAQAILKLKAARTSERLTKGGSVQGIMNTLAFDADSFQPTLKAKFGVQHNLPSHPRRFAEVINQFDKLGYVSLVKDAKGRAKQNARKATPETIKLLNSLFANRGEDFKPTATQVAREYEGFLSGYVDVIDPETGELYSPKGFKSLRERSIKAYLTAWENRIGAHARRSGNRQELIQDYIPHHSLQQPQFAGSLISIDDRQPPFWYDKGKRVWFYVGIDLASEAIVCWVEGKTKEGIIIKFYRQLVRNYAEWGLNLPSGLECESSLNSSFKDTFLKPGNMFEYVRIEANKARSKRIEAYFKPLRYGLEKEREGWIARPTAISESNKAATDKPNKIIPFETIVEGCHADMATWNNMAHSKHNDTSKWDYFLNNQNPELKPTNYKAILPHLGYKQLTSCNVGIMKLQNQEWLLGDNGQVALGENLIRLMRQIEGENVDIYWLDDNHGEVLKAMVYKNGRYICEACPKPKYNRAKNEWTDQDLKAREIMSAYVSTIEAFQKTQIKSIEPVTIIDNRPKTIGNSFQMPGAKKYEPDMNEEVEVLGEIGKDDEWEDVVEYEEPSDFTWKKSFQA